MNIGAIIGGDHFGIWSERIGRSAQSSSPRCWRCRCIPLWAFSTTPLLLALGAFLMQVAVQGAWGNIPAHLNELSPAAVRAMFPGFVYQLGNLHRLAQRRLPGRNRGEPRQTITPSRLRCSAV